MNLVDDYDVFVNEISEQMDLERLRMKYLELEKKDLVAKRYDEISLKEKQLFYLENFNGLHPQYQKLNLQNFDFMLTKINALKEQNEERLELIRKESKCLLEKEFNRII